MSGPTTTGVVGADGNAIAADEWPDGAAPTVVLVHGGGQTRHSWGGTARTLHAAGHRAFAYDQRGHGESDRAPRRDYSHVRFAEDCEAGTRRVRPGPSP